MADISSTLAYAIADTLAMDLQWDDKGGKLTGEKLREFTFGDLRVPLDVKIIDSKVKPDKVTVLVRVLGNLMLLVTASMRRVRVYLLDSAKYDGSALKMLETIDCFDHKRIAEGLGKSMVQVFESEGHSKSRWKLYAA